MATAIPPGLKPIIQASRHYWRDSYRGDLDPAGHPFHRGLIDSTLKLTQQMRVHIWIWRDDSLLSYPSSPVRCLEEAGATIRPVVPDRTGESMPLENHLRVGRTAVRGEGCTGLQSLIA